MRRLICVLILNIVCVHLFAQTQLNSVRGVVYDDANFPIAFVLINLTGTQFTTETDEFGVFILKAPEGNFVLHAQCLGYKNLDTTINIKH